MSPLATLESAKPQIAEVCRKYGVTRLRLFGSVARGEARASSDFDFLVEMDSRRSLLDLGGLQYELQELLGRKVDVVDWPAAKKSDFRGSVESDARVIFAD